MYIVIETHGGLEHAHIVTNEDGSNKVFPTHEQAQEEADNCHDGIVFPSIDDNNPNVVTFQYSVEDVIRTAVSGNMLITPSEAELAFGILKNKCETFDVGTVSVRIVNAVDQRNWATSIDKKQVDDFNTIDDFIYFLHWVMKREQLGGGFHWETPFADYIHTANGEPTYTTRQAVHRQAILDRLLGLHNSPDDVEVHTLCCMVLDDWELIVEDEAVDVLMGRYKPKQ